jgi:hypothetical protein
MEVTTRIAAAEGIVMSMSTSDQHFIKLNLFCFVFKVGSFQIQSFISYVGTVEVKNLHLNERKLYWLIERNTFELVQTVNLILFVNDSKPQIN